VKRTIVLVLLVAGCEQGTPHPGPLPARRGKGTVCVDEWSGVAVGVEYRTLNCTSSGFDLHLVRVDPKAADIDAVRRPGSTATDLGREFLFAMNANFFDEHFAPLGVIVSAGQQVNPTHPVSWQSVFYVTKDGEPGIIPVRGWAEVSAKAAAAVQCGPRLVVHGKKNEVARGEPAWRSGVCIDRQSRVVFFATPPDREFDVHDMAGIAVTSLGCRDAMLFDGGPSTQMYLRRAEGAVSVEGDKRVPAYVVVK
jgi:uncharacterized protein YigE (DUF2233 family)